MSRIFGTDGIRGKANIDVTGATAMSLGGAVVTRFSTPGRRARILVARDTRLSGEMLEGALCAGIASAGGDALTAGILPTPAFSVLCARYGCDAGVMITASHNPFDDNGLKVFGPDGLKLSDDEEDSLQLIMESGAVPACEGSLIGRVTPVPQAAGDYVESVAERFPNTDLTGMKFVIDTANGAAFKTAPAILERLGASVVAIFGEPDGTNINRNCGSTDTSPLRAAVAAEGADAGFALDGDGDRLACIDEKGNEMDGDSVLYVIAGHLKRSGGLPGDAVAATVMTNSGLVIALADQGIKVHRTKVGDRYVAEKMREEGLALGGEQSGHTIASGFLPTGDGTVSALLVASAMVSSSSPLSSLIAGFTRLPQAQREAAASDLFRRTFAQDDAVAAELARLSAKYEQNGRIEVRASGTQPLIRIMIEGPDPLEIESDADDLARFLERRSEGM